MKFLIKAFSITVIIGFMSACGKSSSGDAASTYVPTYNDPYNTNPCGDCSYPPTNDGCGGCTVGTLPPVVNPCVGCTLPPVYIPPTPVPPTPIPSVQPFDSGYHLAWGSFQQCSQYAVTVNVPAAGNYYLSFQGNYTGWYEAYETAKIKLNNGNWHNVKDLDQTYRGAGEVTRSCRVPVTYQLTAAGTYTIYVVGNEHSVNQAAVRITNFYPNNVNCE